MSKQKRNKKLYEDGLLSKQSYVARSQALSNEIEKESAKKDEIINELALRVELLKNKICFT